MATTRANRPLQNNNSHNGQSENLPSPVTVDESTIPEFDCGNLTEICQFCNSRNFSKERPSDKMFTVCCNKGRVILPQIQSSEMIKDLFTGIHEHSKNFMNHIRSFNSSLAFASMGANLAAPPGF